MAEVQIQNVAWWHERLADWMIANPHLTLGDAARYFDVRPAWISIIKNSDCFKQYWESRSSGASAMLVRDIVDRTLAVTEVALDNLSAKLERQGDLMSTDELVDISQMGLKAMGYGAKRSSPPVQININQVSPELLAQARERMRSLHGVEVARPLLEASYESPLLAD